MKKTNLFLSLVVTLLLIGMISAAAPTATISYPASGAKLYNGSAMLVNVTTTGFEAGDMMWNCSLWIYSAGLTGNTSVINLVSPVNITNFSATVAVFDSINYSTKNFAIEDGSDYVIKARCYNTTANANATVTGLISDWTVPQVPSSLSPTTGTTDTDGSREFSGLVTARNTTSCTLNFLGVNPGQSSYDMGLAGGTCSYTINSMPSQSYQWYILASDGLNNSGVSASSNGYQTLQVSRPSGSAGPAVQAGVAQGGVTPETQKEFPVFGVIIAIVIGVSVLWLIFKKK